ncbi:MAG: putative double-strand break repair [Devosia sp.]|uniref:AAA family ATPase n=1 Tax=Devosia sp. TaxID=1871048 RepID=UPI00260CC85D|nr:AAA family ATPase [Devosia sp.]MDB5531019.1 putative double-strand break repair [Devosia sp.]
MKLTALRLHNVKRFAGRGVAIEGISDGVNVLSAANEYGKSTCFEALHALFFQPHTGTPKAVQLLRPYSGGNPMVEADIATDDGRYRLTKQYYGGKRASVTDLASGRLVAQADEAEAFITGLIRGGTGGPAGLLWVRQGITGIDKRSNAEEDSEKRVRESLLSSVQGEVEALTGGRRMAEIAAACEEELYRLVTATLRPKAGGRYAAALEERDKWFALEQRLATEVTTLRDALDKRRIALTRLAELENPDEDAARRAAIAAADKALEAAKSHSEALKAAEAEAALAANRRDTAARILSEFRAALQRAEDLRHQSSLAQSRRDEANANRAGAIAANEQAIASVQVAEQDEHEARDLLARLDAALLARDAAERLTDLRQRLDQADAARKQVEDSEAALALLSLPQQTVDQLQALEIELVGLRAAQAASLPTLRLDYVDGAAGSITIGAEAIPDATDVSFATSLRLDIAGIGTLALRSNRPPQSDQALDRAENKKSSMLAVLGVDSLAGAHQRLAAAREKNTELNLARQRLTDLAPKGLPHLHEEIARLAALSAGNLELKADPEQVRTRLAAATQQVAATRNSARETQPLRSQADAAVVTAETAHAALQAELAALDAILGPENDRPSREISLTAEHVTQKSLHDTAEARAIPLRAAAHDLAGAEATLNRTRSVQNAAEQQVGQLRVTLADLNGHIQARSDNAVEEAWREATESLAAATARVERFETEIAVLDRLLKALATARSAARDLYLKPVITELLPLIGLLFDDISIVFDENTLLPQSVRRNGQDEDVDRLSGGMREQLSVLTRLAFARLLARDGRPTPVILDDALVYSDDDRIERMFDALHRQSRDQQILVFSCRQRAFAKLGGNVLQMQDWTPPA